MRNKSWNIDMAGLLASPEAIVIPTGSFYSSRQKPQTNLTISKDNGQKFSIVTNSPKIKRRSLPNQSSINTNRGVRHHIRRRPCQDLKIDSILSNMRNENLRNRIETNRKEKKQIQVVHNILRKNENPIELARPLRSLNMRDDSNNNKIEHITESATETEGFSDLDSSSDDMDVERMRKSPFEMVKNNEKGCSMIKQQENVDSSNISTSRPETPTENRKFFKSRLTAGIAKEVRITENIKAMVCNGKITLISEKNKVRGRHRKAADFSVAQAAVDDIIKKLDNSNETAQIAEKKTINVEEMVVDNIKEYNCNEELLKEIELESSDDYSDFRNRIPYKTDDPVKAEEQHFLLDFLISYNICNENTFNIFIVDPENHKHEVTKIVNEVLPADNTDDDFCLRIPFNTDDPAVIEQQKHFLEFLTVHNLLTEENFDIFIANYEKRRPEADAILANVLSSGEDINTETITRTDEDENPITALTSNTNGNAVPEERIQSPKPMETNATISDTNPQNLFPIFYPGHCQPLVKNFTRRIRTWNGGHGLSQYQIDAGQKEFGAKQCKQCGLVYGVHEPEEEKLHREFHSSFHVLRFKGWIDEDRIADYPEWGRDGRIIRITDSANTKRRERLNEILKIVDKELGFSSYIIPKTFVAYLAVRNCLIVGFCLVQPLEKANKYICSNGVDCCTIEQFEAKCGISRIWVAPLHRRIHIAKKLLQAVRVNTIMGEEIPFDKIAFSAPTEDGKHFAQKVTGMEDFLVYQ